MTPHDRLISMANQIGRAFAHEGEQQAALSVADHLRAFWDPRMRRGILAHLDAGGQGLTPIALRAVQALRHGGGNPVLGDPTAGDPDAGGERVK